MDAMDARPALKMQPSKPRTFGGIASKGATTMAWSSQQKSESIAAARRVFDGNNNMRQQSQANADRQAEEQQRLSEPGHFDSDASAKNARTSKKRRMYSADLVNPRSRHSEREILMAALGIIKSVSRGNRVKLNDAAVASAHWRLAQKAALASKAIELGVGWPVNHWAWLILSDWYDIQRQFPEFWQDASDKCGRLPLYRRWRRGS